MERSGVIAPKILNQKPLKLPKHLIGKMEHPLEIIVQCIILKNGKLSRASIVKSVDDDLDRLAMEAVHAWKYTAGTYQGHPADIILDVKVVFE